MFINIVIGFVLPWIICFFIFKRDLPFVLHVSTIGALIAFLINELGYFMNWWYVTPKAYGVLSFIPYNIGVFAVLAVFTVHMVNHWGRSWIVIPGMTLVKTILESILVCTGKVVYDNGWNLSLTFFSYLLACSTGYLIYSMTQGVSIKDSGT